MGRNSIPKAKNVFKHDGKQNTMGMMSYKTQKPWAPYIVYITCY